ncbi:MAG TPA: sensor domain-containing protein [Pseudonocardiaceae bacterium]|nr:sensor domain-containing protein [Pseudonocardiaceae bacterium]
MGRFRLAGWGFVLAWLSMVGVAVFCVVATSIAGIAITLGIPLTLGTAPWLRGLADWHRLWTARHLGIAIARPYRPLPPTGRIARVRAMVTDRATYRDLLWVLVDATAGLVLTLLPVTFLLGAVWYAVALPIVIHIVPAPFTANYWLFAVTDVRRALITGIPLAALSFALFWWTTRPLLAAYGRLTRRMLAPPERDRLANRVAQLTESRAETVDTQAAELRRIERDLHDGAQARLVSLGMSLGMAEDLLASNPDAAQELLAEAREATGLALAELRDLVRGIHPPMLADRGLDGAVRALALASALPTEVSIDLPGRCPAPVESAMYFAVAETLTNTAKHSGATSAWIRVAYADGRLGVMIGDDGRGGARQPVGGGLHGIERRLAAFDGTMMVASPASGPTIVTMELPCALSSAKTSPSSETA